MSVCSALSTYCYTYVSQYCCTHMRVFVRVWHIAIRVIGRLPPDFQRWPASIWRCRARERPLKSEWWGFDSALLTAYKTFRCIENSISSIHSFYPSISKERKKSISIIVFEIGLFINHGCYEPSGLVYIKRQCWFYRQCYMQKSKFQILSNNNNKKH